MSVKLSDLVLKPHNGKLVIGKVNKRGNLKNWIDVSTPIIKFILRLLTTESDTYLYQEFIDPKTNKRRHFRITCREMTENEVIKMKQNDEKEKINQKRKIGILMNCILDGLAKNNLELK